MPRHYVPMGLILKDNRRVINRFRKALVVEFMALCFNVIRVMIIFFFIKHDIMIARFRDKAKVVVFNILKPTPFKNFIPVPLKLFKHLIGSLHMSFFVREAFGLINGIGFCLRARFGFFVEFFSDCISNLVNCEFSKGMNEKGVRLV